MLRVREYDRRWRRGRWLLHLFFLTPIVGLGANVDLWPPGAYLHLGPFLIGFDVYIDD